MPPRPPSVPLVPYPRYLRGRVFVLELLPGSQAQADRSLSPGDIIDEINGVSLRNSKNGQVSLGPPGGRLHRTRTCSPPPRPRPRTYLLCLPPFCSLV